MSHAVQGHPRWTGHGEEFWQNVIHRRRKWQPTPVFLSGESHEQYEKAKRYDPEDESPRVEGVQYTTGEEWRAITNSSSKNEQLGQSGNDALITGCLAISLDYRLDASSNPPPVLSQKCNGDWGDMPKLPAENHWKWLKWWKCKIIQLLSYRERKW